MEMAATMSYSLDKEIFSSVSGFGIYDPIQQVLLEQSDLPDGSTNLRRKATSLYSALTSCKFCKAL